MTFEALPAVPPPRPLTRPLQVYAQLFHSQQEAVLQFLSNVPGPTGNSALHFVMTEWVAKHPEFYGKYETKVWRILHCNHSINQS